MRNRHILHPPHTVCVSVCSTFAWLTHTCTRTDTYTPLSHVRWCSCPPPLSPSRDRTCTRTRTGIKGHDSSDDTDTANGKEEEGDAYIGANWVGILGGGMYSLSPLVWTYSVQVCVCVWCVCVCGACACVRACVRACVCL